MRAAALRNYRQLLAAGFHGRRTALGARMRDERTGVDVDLLGTAFEGDERALDRSRRARGLLPVIPLAHLILMKVEGGRSQDDADVVELLKAGASAASVARYLHRTWPELLSRFRRLLARARAERKTRPRRSLPAAGAEPWLTRTPSARAARVRSARRGR